MDLSGWEILCLLLAVVGWLGSILPALPGLPLSLAALIGYGIVTDFAVIGTGTLLLAGLLTVANYFVGYLLGARLARRFGQVEVPAWGIFIASILGSMVMGPIGLLAAPILVVLARALVVGAGLQRGILSALAVAGSMLVEVMMEWLVATWILILLLRAIF